MYVCVCVCFFCFLVVMFLFRNVMFSFINEMFECLINEFVEGRIYKYVKSGVIGCYDFLVFLVLCYQTTHRHIE
jgi:hypothetical protein